MSKSIYEENNTVNKKAFKSLIIIFFYNKIFLLFIFTNFKFFKLTNFIAN